MKLEEYGSIHNLKTPQDWMNHFNHNRLSGRLPVALYSCPDCHEILNGGSNDKHSCDIKPLKATDTPIRPKPFFVALKTALQNKANAYFLGAIIGNCSCPACAQPVLMSSSTAATFFVGKCECGRFVKASIVLNASGARGNWKLLDW